MCDNGYNLSFNAKECEIRKKDIKDLVAEGSRIDSDVYHLSEVNKYNCFAIQREESWL